MLESKMAYILDWRYRPYIFLGLGAAYNTASNYRAYVPFPNLTRQYQNKGVTSFTYSVGFGIDADITKNIRLGVGYRFSDYGKNQLGQANIFGNQVAGTLSQKDLYINTVLVQLSYVYR